MKQCIIGWINLSFLFNFRKIVCEIVYLANVLLFGEIHPFGLGIRESPHSLVLETLAVNKCIEDHGQRSLRSPALGKMWALGLPSCIFIILVFPERFGDGLLRPVKVVQAFLYFIFLMGVRLDLHWQYPDTVSAAVCSEGLILFLFSKGPYSFHYTIATGRIRAQFPSCSH